jgi:SAM-dependent methyltransferase
MIGVVTTHDGVWTRSPAATASRYPHGHGIVWAEWRGLSPGAKLAFAWDGVSTLLARLRRQGFAGRVLAVALVPVAAVYVVVSVLRDTAVARRTRPAVAPRVARRRAYLRHRYGGTQRFVDWREQRLVASLLRRIGRPTRVLDVPSGYGRFTPALDATAVERLVCTDIERSRLQGLRSAAAEQRPPSVVQADLRGALPFATGAFDLVFNLRYLHHADARDEPRRALAELARVSARYLVVSYYRRSNLHAVVRDVQRVTRGNRRRGPYMLERQEFERLLREVGCRAVRARPVLPWFHAQRVVLVEKRPT